jgi:4-phytase/acid phosphatase
MRRRPVHVAGCSHPGECTVDEFAAIAKRGIDRSRVEGALPAMHAQ